MPIGSDDRRANTQKRIQHPVILSRHREHKSFSQFNRKLTRVLGLLYVVTLHVWEDPNVAWIFAKRIR
jgi:hypothetical protein